MGRCVDLVQGQNIGTLAAPLLLEIGWWAGCVSLALPTFPAQGVIEYTDSFFGAAAPGRTTGTGNGL